MSLIARVILMVWCVVGLSACSATRVVHSWVNPQLPHLTKIMVVGVSKGEGMRRLYEDRMSALLSERGVAAVPSYSVLPTIGVPHGELAKQGEVPAEDIERAAVQCGADGVLITRMVRLAHRLDTIPAPAPLWAPGWGPGWAWNGAYGPFWAGYSYDSYRVIEREFAFVETNLTVARGGELLVSVMTRTDDPTYSADQVQGLVESIAQELQTAGVLRADQGTGERQ